MNDDELGDRALSQDRFYSELLLFFAGGALLLAAIGVAGVVSDMVVMRVKEFEFAWFWCAARRNWLW